MHLRDKEKKVKLHMEIRIKLDLFFPKYEEAQLDICDRENS